MNKSYSKIRHIQESNLMLESRLLENKRILNEQSYNVGSDVSFIVGKKHRIMGLDTMGTTCEGISIQLQEVDPTTKKTMGNTIYYYVTRNGAFGSQTGNIQKSDVKLTNGATTEGTEVGNRLEQSTLAKIAYQGMKNAGCK